MAGKQINFGIVVVLVVGLHSVRLQAEGPPQEFLEQLAKADRVLVAIPKETTTAAGGETFRIEIDGSIRGSGKKGVSLTIVNSGDSERFPRYQAGQRYVFLLKKSPDGPRFVNLSTAELPVQDDRVIVSGEGESKQDMTLDDLEELAASSTPKVVDVNARSSTLGRWILIVSQEGVDHPICLLEFSKGEKAGRQQVKMLAATKMIRASSLETTKVEDGNVHLAIIANGDIIDFRGRLRNGTVFGDVLAEQIGLVPARLLATESATMKNYEEPKNSPGVDEFITAYNQDNPEKPLGRFVRRFPESPLAIDALRMIHSSGAKEHLSQETLEPIAENLIATAMGWGPRIGLSAYVDASRHLTRNEHLPELALKFQAAAIERFADDSPQGWKLAVGIDNGKCLVLTGKEAEGLAIWKDLLEKHSFEPDLMWMVANQLEKSGQVDEALPIMAKIVALPKMELMVVESSGAGKRLPRDQRPSAVLERLWKKKNGSTSGLQKYLNEVFDKTVQEVAGEKRLKRNPDKGSRIVLCELFTGASCDPCCGADFITSALEAAFSKTEVIVVRYHVHHPRPDPLASEETQKRYEQYEAEGTPSVFINGRKFDAPGGYMQHVTGNFRRLVDEVEPYLVEKTDLKLELSAKVNQGKIAIAAKAAGLKSFPQDLRMRLVLVEDRVSYPAPNGINVHEMLVRTMPGGADGIAPVNGKLEFKEEIDLARLRNRLIKHLKRVESEASVEFPEKPFDFKSLHLVAYLQDSENGEVLQSAAIPITAMEPATDNGAPAAKKSTSGGSPATGGN